MAASLSARISEAPAYFHFAVPGRPSNSNSAERCQHYLVDGYHGEASSTFPALYPCNEVSSRGSRATTMLQSATGPPGSSSYIRYESNRTTSVWQHRLIDPCHGHPWQCYMPPNLNTALNPVFEQA